ncbi:MAG: hypothetical protein HC874_23610 [Richelia sp. SL_2_1]|nr:hypothetical protein [Richelia sp. SL_2_1]
MMLNTIEKLVIGDIAGKYTVGMCYLKSVEFGIKNEISKNSRDLFKPYGELLVSLLELCKDCHFYEDFYKDSNFKNGFHWFKECLKELMFLEYRIGYTKNNMWSHWEKILRQLKVEKNYPNQFESTAFNNPFAEYGSPALSLLIEQSLYMCKNPRFKEKKWNHSLKV